MEGLASSLGKLLGPLSKSPARVWGTPRRFAVAFPEVDARQPMTERLVTGPPAAAGEGAAAAFARKHGADPATLERAAGPKGEVFALRKLEGGESTAALVAANLHDLLLGLPFKRTMRWSDVPHRFPRPVLGVCATLGGEPIEGTALGLVFEATSNGHWLAAPGPFPVTTSAGWVAELRARWVIADRDERRQTIARQAEERAGALGSTVLLDPELLDEVTDLVEWPVVIDGQFDAGLLELPPRLLVEAMKVHQRYFPLFRDGKLDHRFLLVSNNPTGDPAVIATGNARVLAARFADARFFYAEDRKKRLEEHGARLAGMTWIRGLGTMAERQDAVARHAVALAGLVGADARRTELAARVGKCDLATQMVGEFPELQGHVGGLLAAIEGNPAAMAIEEQYHPRFSGDTLPQTGEGRALALAERISLLGAAFAAEMAPVGSADPLGLRRAAAGVVAIVLDLGVRLPLRTLLAAGGADRDDVATFVVARLRAALEAEAATDLVDAVLAADATDLVSVAERVRAIAALAHEGRFAPIRASFRRVAGLVKEHRAADYRVDLFDGDAEYQLHLAARRLPDATQLADFLVGLEALRPTVDAFFDHVLVMCEDAKLRNNRLSLLRSLVDRFAALADFTRFSSD
jgi:glycyl-tRNA synthetase beta chain